MRFRHSRAAEVWIVGTLALGALACGDGAGPSAQGNIAVRFGTIAPPASASVRSTELLPASTAVAETPLALTGDNGTLEITDVHLIVDKIELEQAEGACTTTGEENECEEFKAPPAFVDVPLDGGSTLVISETVPPGEYVSMQLGVDNAEADHEDSGENQQIAALLTEIRSQFPDWPEKASMLVTGTFTPTGGDPRPFRVYFSAEIEVERALQPPLTVVSDGTQDLTVNLDPSAWFASAGHVMDLSQYDYDSTGQVVDFEAEMEHGIVEVEHEDHG